MKLQRFFVGSACEENTTLCIPSLELLHQLKSVFRMTTGNQVILFDNSGYDFEAIIEGFDKESVSFDIKGKTLNTVQPPRETYLFASIVKKDTFEWIAEKATEMGVSHIVPVLSERSEKKNLNMERLQKIIQEAAEQSGRATVPKLHDILELAEVVANYSYLLSVAWEPIGEKFTQEKLADVQGVYVGPEGGWTKEELEMFTENKIKILSLGPQVLRAETAVIASLAQIVF